MSTGDAQHAIDAAFDEMDRERLWAAVWHLRDLSEAAVRAELQERVMDIFPPDFSLETVLRAIREGRR